MKSRIFLNVLATLIAVGLPPGQLFGSSLQRREPIPDRCWAKETECGVSLWTAVNVVIRNSPPSLRFVFVYLEPQSFTEVNLRRLVVCLSQKYSKPEYLIIKARSDRTSLQRWIDHYLAVHSVRADGSSKRSVYPPVDLSDELTNEVGFYRANYDRTDDCEEFSFSDDPNSSGMSHIILAQNFPYRPSGDSAADLVRASGAGFEQQVRHLLQNGAEVNNTNRFGTTPLIAAIHWRSLTVANLLIENGANVNQSDPDGWTPLMYAVAVRKGDNEIVEKLLRSGADVNARAENGDTALIVATNRDAVPILRRLLEKGADPEARDRYGRTSLMIAQEYGRQTAIALLKEAVRKK